MSIVERAKEIGLIPNEANEFKSLILLKIILASFGRVNADLTDLHKLLGIVFGKSLLQMKHIYEAEFDQYYRMLAKIKRNL